jgi:hypothetical protein
MKEILDGLQARLLSDLIAARSALRHPSARGAAAEDAWLALLKEHLPFRYQTERGFVIDHTEHPVRLSILSFLIANAHL